MKKFILKTLKFSLVLVSIGVLNFALNTLIIKNSEVPVKKRRVLIAGDSHTQFAINPALFYSAENISQTGEPYVVTYWKLKYLFNTYRPDVLVLGFSPHNISAFNDYKFSDKKWSGELFRRSYAIGEFDLLGNSLTVDYGEYYRTCLRRMFLFPHSNHFAFIGGYTAKRESHLANIGTAAGRHYFLEDKPLGVSEHSVVYLDSIISLCRRNNVKAKLIGCPVHPEYYKKIPHEFMKRYNAEKERLATAGVPVLDFSGNFYDDNYYYDEDHLNEKGATVFTNELIRRLWEKEPIRFIEANNP